MEFNQSKRPHLYEYITYDNARCQLFEEDNRNTGLKDLCMKGVFIQGDIRNQNQRVYPSREIARAVNEMNKKIQSTNGIFGEGDHPEELSINIDRISHVISDVWMEGTDGHGKLKVLDTPIGNIVKTLLKSGVKLGVSSRGSGNVGDDGTVSDFEIVTVDIVVQPSAPDAYPRVIYESLYNMKGGSRIIDTARYAHTDKSAKRQIETDLKKLIKELKI